MPTDPTPPPAKAPGQDRTHWSSCQAGLRYGAECTCGDMPAPTPDAPTPTAAASDDSEEARKIAWEAFSREWTAPNGKLYAAPYAAFDAGWNARGAAAAAEREAEAAGLRALLNDARKRLATLYTSLAEIDGPAYAGVTAAILRERDAVLAKIDAALAAAPARDRAGSHPLGSDAASR